MARQMMNRTRWKQIEALKAEAQRKKAAEEKAELVRKMQYQNDPEAGQF